MFVNKLESEKGELEIVYDVQWKTPGNDDDKAKIIGIVDTPDTNLDWNTFKSYLIQNSGNMRFTTDDIRISYLDSDDDLIPIDSELEFRECLKFSRIRARRGRKIVMKVNMMSNGGVKPKNPSKYNEEVKSKHINPKLFCLKKKDMKERLEPKKTFSFVSSQCSETVENKDETPKWFENYMSKFKKELIDEITTTVVNNLQISPSGGPPTTNVVGPTNYSRNRNAIDLSQSNSASAGKGHHHHHHQLHHVIEKRKKKKKMPEEDSSDCTDGLQLQWEEKLELLRHMQKINKREKKFEKKLDAKLEKLECKTKKIMEKKHTLWNTKKSTGIPLPQSAIPATSWASSAPLPPTTNSCDLVMDATPVDEFNYVPHVLRGELVHQAWKVMNDGQLPWTDETELRFAWGSKSLVPLTTVVKCPLLKPGETGKIKVSLQAPLFPGNFESYWHFHHQGRRFGHWLGCAVIVDPDPRPDTPVEATEPQQNSCGLYNLEPLPVDLTMKCQQTYTAGYDSKTSTTDDMKIYNIETKPEGSDENKTKAEEPTKQTVQNITSAKSVDPTLILAAETLKHCVIDTELEEFPKLETYASLKPEISPFISESFPDLVQGNDDTVAMARPDLNTWAQYLPHGANNIVEVADLLNIKENYTAENDTNVCTNSDTKDSSDKYEKIISGVKDLSIQDDTKKVDDNVTDAFEYNSGSDSDNISIISGTVSVDTDDTEPSDEFVVVPMPTCSNYETSCDSQVSVPVTEPITVEIPSLSSDSDISAHNVHTSDNNNNMELKPYPVMPSVCLPALYSAENCSLGSSNALENCSLSSSGAAVSEAPASDTNAIVEFKEEQKSSDDENTVYVRDASGKSVPIAKVVVSKKDSTDMNSDLLAGLGIIAGVGHSTFGDPSFGHGPNGPRFPFTCGNDGITSPPLCHNPGGPCNFRPQHESPAYGTAAAAMSFSLTEGNKSHFCQEENEPEPQPSSRQDVLQAIITQKLQKQHQQKQQQQQPKQQQQQPKQQQQQPLRPTCSYRAPPPYYPFDEMYQNQEMAKAGVTRNTSSPSPRNTSSPKTYANPYHNIHTEQPRACKYTYVYNDGVKNIPANTSFASPKAKSGRGSSSESRETSPVAAAVQILPETLVTGAVNVASSAINTARSVIDMLRPRQEPVVAQWETVPAVMENSLQILSEMGFKNRELNIMLLSQHNNDVTRVISELVQ